MQIERLNPANHQDSVRAFKKFCELGDLSATLDSLSAILGAFARLPYENISKIIKWNASWKDGSPGIRLPEEVIQGHFDHRLGGTCFSLTFFLQAILTQHRFECYPVMADMRAGENIHCGLIVRLGRRKHLVDPGYLLTQPMELHPSKPRLFRSPVSGVQVQQDAQSGYYNLFTFDKTVTKWRYRFKDRPVGPTEFQQHWHASFDWPSMHGICLTKIMNDGMVYINKNFMRETTFEGKRNFNIRKTYHASIRAAFGINPQVVEQAQCALQENLQRKRDLGLWLPKGSSNAIEIHAAR